MTRRPPAQSEDTLRHVAQQFSQWRQRRTTSRGRIPQALWEQAVTLTRELPLSRVAKQLGLRPQRLRTRCRGQAGPAGGSPLPAALPFVEVASAWRSPTAEVEVQRPDGRRLHISYHEAAPTLVPLLQTFLEFR